MRMLFNIMLNAGRRRVRRPAAPNPCPNPAGRVSHGRPTPRKPPDGVLNAPGRFPLKQNMIKLICCAIMFLAAVWPVLANGEALMTRLYFDQWLVRSTAALEARIQQKEAEIQWLEAEISALKGHWMTEIILKIGDARGTVDGQVHTLDVPPILLEGRTLVPLRFVGERMGAQVEWAAALKKAIYRKNDVVLEMVLDQPEVLVNGQALTLDVSPRLADGRILIPLRFVGEHMGASVQWNEADQSITIQVSVRGI